MVGQLINLINGVLVFIKEVWAKDWFDPHSSFLRLRSFWVPFLVIFAVFIFLCWKVSIEKELKLDLIEWTVSDMYDWFKIPLWVLALLIPIIGLFNANHKSEQTRASMELTKAQNTFANYYKHLEEFSKFAKDVAKPYESSIEINIKLLHSELFPDSDAGDYKIFTGVGSVLDAVRLLISLTNKDINNFIKKKELADDVTEDGREFLKKQTEYFNLLKDYFGFIGQRTEGFLSYERDENLICRFDPVAFNRINQIYVMLKMLNRLVAFDPKVELPLKNFHDDYRTAFLPLWSGHRIRNVS